MSKLYREALTVVRARLHEQDPRKADELSLKTTAAALSNPDDDRNIFYATVDWPTVDDPFSSVGLRANFPGERLKNGQGYLGVKFLRADQIQSSLVNTELLIHYGIGSIGLLEPVGIHITKTIDGEDRPRYSGNHSDVATVLLGKFGIRA